MIPFAQLPNAASGGGGCAAWRQSPLPAGGCAARIRASGSPCEPARRCMPCLRTDVASAGRPDPAALLRRHQASAPEASRRAHSRRRRLSTTGFHLRRRAGCAGSLFFPRSVGFGPTASNANGAFTMEPSMLCQAQAIPSMSSYSARLLRHRRTKNPARFQSRKYLWMELALPNCSLGKAFHWHPVRSTYTMPANIFRAGRGFRPPPGFRRYLRPRSRWRCGISGSTLAHSSSDTVHDLPDLLVCMLRHCRTNPKSMQYVNYG
jgi:hypothetical protein